MLLEKLNQFHVLPSVLKCAVMELPFQTYERLTDNRWPGGTSPEILTLLRIYGIGWPAGSAEANVVLQYCLLHANPVIS
jgi:hypothetical protein